MTHFDDRGQPIVSTRCCTSLTDYADDQKRSDKKKRQADRAAQKAEAAQRAAARKASMGCRR